MDKTGYALAEFMTLIKIIFLSLMVIYLSNNSQSGPVNDLNTKSLKVPPLDSETSEETSSTSTLPYDPSYNELPTEAAYRIQGEILQLQSQPELEGPLVIEITPDLMDVLYNAPSGIKFIAVKDA